MPSRVVLTNLTLGALLVSAPVFSIADSKVPAKPVTTTSAPLNMSGWTMTWADDRLEARWSWHATLKPKANYELRVACGFDDAEPSGVLLRLSGNAGASRAQFWRVQGAKATALTPLSSSFPGAGELSLQRFGKNLRVLWNGEIVLETPAALPGTRFGSAVHGDAGFDPTDVQPTEPVVFRDDFMRAAGPDDKEAPGEWKTNGIWKTSSLLRPRMDASLNPNPFVFRASGPESGVIAEPVATAGKWFWTDYSISASVRPNLEDANSPAVAALEGFRQPNGMSIRGEVDFRLGQAFLRQGSRVLAKSALFEPQANQWHKIKLEPGPGTARLYLDGVEVLSAPSNLAQGLVALSARTGGSNFIDFDDVRVGVPSEDGQWGEGSLPERFIKDRLMKNWASNSAAWQRDGSGTWWHTGDFFGPAVVELKLPETKPGEGFQILRAGEDKKPLGTFSIANTGDSNYHWSWERAGQTRTGDVKSTQRALRVGDNSAFLGPQELFSAVIATNVSQSAPGIRVGVRPTRDGAGVPLPQLESVKLQSSSVERDGRTVIGVNITPVTSDLAKEIGLPDPNGAIVDAIETGAPAAKAGVQVGDVIREVEGKKITDIDSLVAAVGGMKAGDTIHFTVSRRPPDASGLDWESALVTTPRVLDYSFTSAPVDWNSAKGIWEVTERWTCSPQWSFFAGKDDANPTLWSRFKTQGDWTLEAYLATPMDLARGERSPSDLNITVGGDGRDIASGYSFLFAGKSRSVNQIRRGDDVAWEKPFQPIPGTGDTHQDWFYIRLEKRETDKGRLFRYSVNGRLIDQYLDPKPLPDGGRVAFWTVRGGLSIARVRLWNSGLAAAELPWTKPVATPLPLAQPKTGTVPDKARIQLTALDKPAVPAATLTNDLGTWTPRDANGGTSAKIEAKPGLISITNPVSGGDWTFYATRNPFDARRHPVITFDYSLPAGVKLNMYALVDDRWREIVFTGPRRATSDSDSDYMGTVADVKADGQFHAAQFDILAALKSKGIQGDSAKVQALAFAAPDVDYLRAGLGGNHWGSEVKFRNFKAPEAGSGAG